MARDQYKSEKRRKELARQKKQAEKRERRHHKREAEGQGDMPEETTGSAPDEPATEPQTGFTPEADR